MPFEKTFSFYPLKLLPCSCTESKWIIVLYNHHIYLYFGSLKNVTETTLWNDTGNLCKVPRTYTGFEMRSSRLVNT